MLRRVIENVLVAVVASAVTWAASNPGDSAGAADLAVDRVLSGVAIYGGPLDGWLWSAAIALAAIGIALQVLSMAPRHPSASWEWSVSMPSAPTTLVGIGVTLGLIAHAVGLAAAASLWALPLLAAVAYWAFRWLESIRYRWTSMAGAL